MATFFDYYQKQIRPQIEKADLFLKTASEPYSAKQIASVFGICDAQIQPVWTKDALIWHLKNQPEGLWKMFQKELCCGLPDIYTVAQISYIYDIALEVVEQAAEHIGLSNCPKTLLPLLFDAIDLSHTQYSL